MQNFLRAALFTALVSWSLPVLAQTCTPPANWRPPLVYFCADTPAQASQVNGNFGKLVEWLEAKVGPVGQPFSPDAGVVTTSALADGAVTTAKIAPLNVDGSRLANGAVDSTKLAAGAVTRDKLADGGVRVYSVSSSCQGGGALTLASTCTYVTSACGTCLVVGLTAFSLCDGSCPTQAGQCNTVARACTANNTLRGYLVAP